MTRKIVFSVCVMQVALLLVATRLPAQQVSPRIINGVPTELFESVGIVGSTTLGQFCTGTLISPFHVLTAAHCAEAIDSPTNGVFEILGQEYRTSRLFVHPNYNSRTLANDIAVLELADPVLDVAPAAIYTGVPQVGDPLAIVGFGESGDAGGGNGQFGVKLQGITTIDAVTDTLIIWEFDDPNESNTAPGDSGGPGFLEVGGEMFIASITSGGTEPGGAFGDIAFNTRVDVYAAWINGILDAGPVDGGPVEPGTPPVSDEPPPTSDEPPATGGQPPATGGENPAPTECPGTHRPHRPAFGHRPGLHYRPGMHHRPGSFERPQPPAKPAAVAPATIPDTAPATQPAATTAARPTAPVSYGRPTYAPGRDRQRSLNSP